MIKGLTTSLPFHVLMTPSVCLKIWDPEPIPIISGNGQKKINRSLGQNYQYFYPLKKKLGVTDHQGDPQVLGCFASDIMM